MRAKRKSGGRKVVKLPKPGDMLFTGFESDYVYSTLTPTNWLRIVAVEGKIETAGVEGRSVTCSDNVGYDCFWSKKHQVFVYALV